MFAFSSCGPENNEPQQRILDFSEVEHYIGFGVGSYWFYENLQGELDTITIDYADSDVKSIKRKENENEIVAYRYCAKQTSSLEKSTEDKIPYNLFPCNLNSFYNSYYRNTLIKYDSNGTYVGFVTSFFYPFELNLQMNSPSYVEIVSIDDFKTINDSIYHDVICFKIFTDPLNANNHSFNYYARDVGVICKELYKPSNNTLVDSWKLITYKLM